MDALLAILFGIFIYVLLCLLIAGIRALFSKTGTKSQTFKKHFGPGSLRRSIHFIGFGDRWIAAIFQISSKRTEIKNARQIGERFAGYSLTL